MRKPLLNQRAKTFDIINKSNTKKRRNTGVLTKSIDNYKNNVFNKFENIINFLKIKFLNIF